jgi:hypothetical protein
VSERTVPNEPDKRRHTTCGLTTVAPPVCVRDDTRMVARDRLSYVLGLRLLKPFRHSEYRRLIAALAVSVIGAGCGPS